jgi:hypothetical protein
MEFSSRIVKSHKRIGRDIGGGEWYVTGAYNGGVYFGRSSEE